MTSSTSRFTARELYFRATAYVTALRSLPQRQVAFTVERGSASVALEWRWPTITEVHRWGPPHGTLDSVLTATVVATVNGRPGAFLSGIAAGHWPIEVAPLPEPVEGWSPLTGSDGRLNDGPEGQTIFATAFPDKAGRAFRHVAESLEALVARTVRTLAWRAGNRGRTTVTLRQANVQLSNDGVRWVSVIDNRSWRLINATPITTSLDANPTALNAVAQALDAKHGDPVAFDLLREARRVSSLRSTLVLAVAAAEVGYKRAAANLTPRLAERIMRQENFIGRLVTDLPHLPVRATWPGGPRCPEHIHGVLRDAADRRNALLHGGADITAVTIIPILTAVDDLLWLLEYYKGHKWALTYLSNSTRVEFGLQPLAPEPDLILQLPA